ncbi:MAG: RNA methyltransferase [Microcoleaceae cyanobacterium]
MSELADFSALAELRIVLVEPAGALNVGSVARIMKNMGLKQLVLVNPQCDHQGDEARKMAVHARDLLERAFVVPDIPAALQNCQRAIATTARERSLETPLVPPRSGLSWLLQHPSALIFGPEDRGLSNQELNYAQRFVRIPSNPDYPSLNLAQAVAVCCYELYQMALTTDGSLPQAFPDQGFIAQTPVLSEDSVNNSVSLDFLEDYYQQLEHLLLKIGYLYPHTAKSRMEKFRRLFNRANLSAVEVAMLRGIFSQVEWAIENFQKSSTVDDTLGTQPRPLGDTLRDSE